VRKKATKNTSGEENKQEEKYQKNKDIKERN